MAVPDEDMAVPDVDMAVPDEDMAVPDEDMGPPNPESISAQNTRPTRIKGGNAGDSFDDDCPPGHVVHGIEGESVRDDRRWIHRIRTLCALVEIRPDGVRTIAGPVVPPDGFRGRLQGEERWQSTCNPNQAVVGFRGHSGSHVDSLAIACSPLNVDEDAGRVIPDRAQLDWRPAVGFPGGRAFNDILCPDGKGATGSVIRAEAMLNAYGLRCSNLPIVPLDEE